MTLKLDISKAYDKIRREFLFQILIKLGFKENFISIIQATIDIIKFSILVNGAPGICFTSSQELRKGDRLSSYLFIIIAEVMGRNLKALIGNEKIKGNKLASSNPP